MSPTAFRIPSPAVSTPVTTLSIDRIGLAGSITSVGSVAVLLSRFGSSEIVVTVTVLLRSSSPPVGASRLTLTVTVKVRLSPTASAPRSQVTVSSEGSPAVPPLL